MLTVHGMRGATRRCDGVSRRSFLRAGVLGLGGCSLALPDLLRAEAAAGARAARRAVIIVHLDGGPSQMDLIDPKPEAPSGAASRFRPIRTNVPGIHLTELMPRVASAADRFAFLRSLVGAANKHDAFQCQSGFDERSLAPLGGRPALGCVVNKLLGSTDDPAPAFVDIMQGRPFVRDSARPGFLGPTFQPFRPNIDHLFKRELEDGMKIELARRGAEHSVRLALTEGLDAGRLGDRIGLLAQLDRTRRAIDSSGSMEAMDAFTTQAFGILTSGRLAEAMDLEGEDPRVLEKFRPPMKVERLAAYTSEGPEAALKLLLARRLIEAGVRVVSVSISDFDTHGDNEKRMAQLGPIIDHALWALVTDLEERGMLDDVLVLAWGEFGRTPQINSKGGRDHWPNVAMGIMAGGGLNTGQVIGETDRVAGEAVSRPIHYQDVIATLYHHLGIDPRTTTVTDPTGRPQYLVEEGTPIGELVG